MKKFVTFFLIPIAIVLAGAGVFYLMMSSRETPAMKIPEKLVPIVRVYTAHEQSHQLEVQSRGTVRARTETMLLPEVSGRIVKVSPAFAEGAFFAEGDVLLRLDPLDYEQALSQARSQRTEVDWQLAREEAEAALALEEWQEDNGDLPAPPLTAHVPQLTAFRARQEAALATEKRARRNLERTQIRAPYDGRVVERMANLGQVVSPATPLGKIYATDVLEVNLPVPIDRFAFLELPLDFDSHRVGRAGPAVTLQSSFAGKDLEWVGSIVRIQAAVDPRSHMIDLIAAVPYKPPLTPGMTVGARIAGRSIASGIAFPRAALRDDNTVLIVDKQDRLRFRPVDVLRADDYEVIVQDGLTEGDRIVLTPLTVVSDGMQVRISGEEDR
jgi:RND family efflux transporter MFP subunit